MLSRQSDEVGWAAFVTELDEAREHLTKLVDQLAAHGAIDEEDLRVDLGHIYAHLNRAWHSRGLEGGTIPGESWDAYSAFPRDIAPVG